MGREPERRRGVLSIDIDGAAVVEARGIESFHPSCAAQCKIRRVRPDRLSVRADGGIGEESWTCGNQAAMVGQCEVCGAPRIHKNNSARNQLAAALERAVVEAQLIIDNEIARASEQAANPRAIEFLPAEVAQHK